MDNKKHKFFYGWVIVGCLLLIAILPMVLVSNFFSYYQVPMCNDFGCSYSQFNISNMASTIAGILFSLTMAGKIGQGNTRLYMLIGGLVCALAYLAQSYITAIWQLYITFAIANFALSAITYVPINLLISQWFIDRKGLVTSIVFAGMGLGGMLFSGVLADILSQHGWRSGFRVTALVVAVTIIIVYIFVRKTPAEMGLEPYRSANKKAAAETTAAPVLWEGISKSEAIKKGSFIFYALCLLCCGIVAAGVFTQIPTFLIDNKVDYAAVMAVYSGVQIIGQLCIGPLVDKAGIQKGALITSLIACVALVFLILVPTMGASAAYIAMCIIPFGSGIVGLAPPLLTGTLFGYKDYSGIYGLGNALFMAGCMVGPMLSSTMRDVTGSYITAWITFIGVYLLLGISAILAVSASRKYIPKKEV